MREDKNRIPAHFISLSINMEKTGANLKRLINASGYSMDEIMTFTGVSTPQAIYKWYSGKSIPSMETLVVLSEILGMNIRSLLVIDGDFGEEPVDDSTAG